MSHDWSNVMVRTHALSLQSAKILSDTHANTHTKTHTHTKIHTHTHTHTFKDI